jgi:hypothetical protein
LFTSDYSSSKTDLEHKINDFNKFEKDLISKNINVLMEKVQNDDESKYLF